LVLKHVTAQGIFGASREAWSWVVGVVSKGLIQPEALVTHEFPLEQHERAFQLLLEGDPGTLKVQFAM
jgi:threonine dehydrogenase-like Zn-dependent dehydrogenase